MSEVVVDRSKALWHWVADHRIVLSSTVFGLLIIEDIIEPQIPRDADSFADPVGLLGGLLVLAGIALRSWAAGHLDKGRTLTVTGPYAVSRNPLYVGSMLAATGFCVVLWDIENLFGALLIGLAVYLPKAAREEKKLRRLFGDAWDGYAQRVGRLVTLPWRVDPADLFGARWRATTWMRNHEYRFACAALSGLAILEVLHHALT